MCCCIYTPILEIKKVRKEPQVVLCQIYKDISLKELDYRLRERAIKQHGLYSNGLKQGQITNYNERWQITYYRFKSKTKRTLWVILSTADKYKNSSRK